MSHKNCLKRLKNRIFSFAFITLFLTLVLGILLSDTTYAQTSDNINLQGKIVRNDTGYEGLNVVNGTPTCVASGADTCDFQIKYYSAPTSGTLYLTETFSDVEIGDYGGVFNLSLGSGSFTTTSECDDGTCNTPDEVIKEFTTLYMEIGFAPGGASSFTEVFTRTALNASAYAIRSEYSAGSIPDSFNFFNSSSSSGITTTTGSVYYDTGDSELKVYTGAAWVPVGGGASSDLWTDGGTFAYLTTTADDLVLGGSTPGTSKFFFDVSEGRLGIGTDTPSSSIDIAGASSSISNSTGDITITPAEDLYINGDVGIGNADPSGVLDVNGESYFRDNINMTNSSYTSITPEIAFSGSNVQPSNIYATNGGLQLVSNNVTASTKITAPLYGTGNARGSAAAPLFYASGNLGASNYGGMFFPNSSGSGSPTHVAFSTDGLERLRITTDGDVGIGVTSPTAYLHLKAGTASANTAPFKFTSGTNLTTPESGAMEWDGSRLYITDTNPTRETIAYTSDFSGSLLPTGTEGQLLYNNAGTWTAFSDMYWDDSSGYLGIGTTNPFSALHVWDDLTLSGQASYLSSAQLGDFQYSLASKAYIDFQDNSKISNGNLTHIDSDYQGDVAWGVWGDGKFVYIANDDGGLHSYSVDLSGDFTHIDSDDQGGYATGVWGDGKFVYLANDSGGIHTYSVNSSGTLTHIDSDSPGDYSYSIWGDGKYIYLANATGGLHSYSVDSSGNLTHIDSDDQGDTAYSVWGDGEFIYLANWGGGLHTYSVDSSGNLTHIDFDDPDDNARGVWGDGEFIYLANDTGGLHTYSVDLSGNLTHIDSDDQGGNAIAVWGDGRYIYLANAGEGIHTYSVDSSGTLTHIDYDDQGGNARSIWGDGKFIYLANFTGGLSSYSIDSAYEYDKENQQNLFTGDINIESSYGYLLSGNEIAWPSDTDLSLYWNLDEGSGTQTIENSDTGYTGTIVSATYTDGISGKALSFNGTTSGVTVSDGVSFGDNTEFTVSLWFNADSLNDEMLLGGSNANGQFRIDDLNSITVRNNSGSSNIDLSEDLSTDVWYHLVVTRDTSGNLRAYLNGVDKTSVSPVRSESKSFKNIGARSDYHSSYLFDGEIDEIRIYDRKITEAEIRGLYKYPSGNRTATIAARQLRGDIHVNSSGFVGIGTTTPGARLDIEGSSDSVQFEVKGNATQTSNLLQIKKSDDTVLLSLANSGLLTLAGNFESGTNNTYDVGSTTTRWKDVYTQGNIEIGENGDSGNIRYNTSNDELEFSNDGSNWIPLGDIAKTETVSAEYAGAVLAADSTNNTGSMTSDAEGSASNSMNYYEWNSSETTLQDYDVRVRYTIPSDFSSWGTNAFTLNYATESTSSANSKVDIYVYLESSGTVDDSSVDQVSGTGGVWTTTNIQGADLGDCNAAGETCLILIRMYSKDDNYVRIGDIDVNYNRKL